MKNVVVVVVVSIQVFVLIQCAVIRRKKFPTEYGKSTIMPIEMLFSR